MSLLSMPVNVIARDQINKNTLIVVTEHLPPYQIGKSGKLIGGNIGLKVKPIIDEHYPDAIIDVMTWARAYRIALSRPNTLIFSIVRTPERESLFHWIAKVDSVPTKLIALVDHPINPIKSLQEIKGYKIGIKRSDAVSFVFLKQGFDYNKGLIEIVNTISTMKMLSKGRIDIIPANDRIIDYFCELNGCKRSDFKVIYQFEELSEDFYIAASKGTDPKLLAILKEQFKVIDMQSSF